MTAAEIHQRLVEGCGSAVLGFEAEIAQPCIEIDPMRAGDVAAFLKDELGFDRLLLISGIDYEGYDEKGKGKHREISQYEEDGTVRPVEDPATGQLGAIYHLEALDARARIALKVHIDREEPRIQSVSHVWNTAIWLERETYDMYGIEFVGNPDLRRLLLPEDWVGWPLRKDYEMPKIYNDIPLEGLPLAVRDDQS